jgi:hypothetical protein
MATIRFSIQKRDADPNNAVNLIIHQGRLWYPNGTAGAGQCDPIAGLGCCLLAAW